MFCGWDFSSDFFISACYLFNPSSEEVLIWLLVFYLFIYFFITIIIRDVPPSFEAWDTLIHQTWHPFYILFFAYKPTHFPAIIHLFTYSVLVFILSNLILLNIHLDVTKWVLSSEYLYFLIYCIAESSIGAVE